MDHWLERVLAGPKSLVAQSLALKIANQALCLQRIPAAADAQAQLQEQGELL